MIKYEGGFNETQEIEAMGWNSAYASVDNPVLRKKERERITQIRKYFEGGCMCVRDGVIEKKGAGCSDVGAVIYYELVCQCSRNYKQQ